MPRMYQDESDDLYSLLPRAEASSTTLEAEKRDRRRSSRCTKSVAKPRAAEFFAGIGLVRLALERSGWSVEFANDIDAGKAKMYAHNWPRSNDLLVGDIHRLRAEQLPTVDLFTASFPCNDLSIAGKWQGLNGKESSAFWGLIRLLGDLGGRRPPLILLENVVGFLQSNGGRDLETSLAALVGLGYAVDAFIVNASHWTPQSRARMFVVAKLDWTRDRQATAEPSQHRPKRLAAFINASPHLRWDLQNLPRLPNRKVMLTDILEDLADDDPHWWSDERRAYFMSQLSFKHEVQAKLMIGSTVIRYATAFRRVRNGRSMAELRTDGIAGCLRTPRGGSGRQILFKAGSGRHQVRLLTARECARLQGVPEDYQIRVGLNQALFGFGDGVCVPVIRWIARHCLSPLAADVVRQPGLFGGAA